MMAGAVYMSDMLLRWRAAPKVEEEFDLMVQSAADFVADVQQSRAQTIGGRAADDVCAKARRAKARELDGRGVRSRNIDAPPVINRKWEKKALDPFASARLDHLDGARIDSDITNSPDAALAGLEPGSQGFRRIDLKGPAPMSFSMWTAGTSVMTARRPGCVSRGV
jgi:hypothetical protein